MPNWVYNTIKINDALTDKQKQILEQIKQKGLCEHYLPMPTTLNITSGSAVDNARKILGDEFGTIPKDKGNLTDKDFEEAKQSFINEKLYGSKDWYDWKCRNYGTKWGDCDTDVDLDNASIRYDTAWSPLTIEIIEKFANDFPNFDYELEEEQGFGESWESIDGELSLTDEWDIPNMEEVDLDEGDYVYELKDEHRGLKMGYYSDWNPSEDSYLGETLEEVKENLI